MTNYQQKGRGQSHMIPFEILGLSNFFGTD